MIPKFKFKSGDSKFIVVQEPTSYEEADPGKGYGRLRDVANFLEPQRVSVSVVCSLSFSCCHRFYKYVQ